MELGRSFPTVLGIKLQWLLNGPTSEIRYVPGQRLADETRSDKRKGRDGFVKE